MTEREIIDRFYNIWFRCPTSKEFKKCGGDLDYVVQKYGEYLSMLEYFGMSQYLYLTTDAKIIKAVHDDGRIFTGVYEDVAAEVGFGIQTIKKLIKSNEKKKGWTFSWFPFDVEIFNSYEE